MGRFVLGVVWTCDQCGKQIESPAFKNPEGWVVVNIGGGSAIQDGAVINSYPSSERHLCSVGCWGLTGWVRGD